MRPVCLRVLNWARHRVALLDQSGRNNCPKALALHQNDALMRSGHTGGYLQRTAPVPIAQLADIGDNIGIAQAAPGIFTAPWWPAKLAIVFSVFTCAIIFAFKAVLGDRKPASLGSGESPV